ncbi:hypothetical protein [Chelatococcus asaccharovorans]|uniref:Uncharacterized protein n=1 Tax=Chelatococcus asaccharovorans TaxID=28210 RepID=A0A2V3UAW1_9HYPH|nr:hypothetical protein [Chelatococcus asaccharovorans]MBS7703330.1 hypothetical protein [Chelatococcus asaccharovorans]PXW61664.1 hypothetical protein C7450_103181 [Chelatococcus asaccharovorans]
MRKYLVAAGCFFFSLSSALSAEPCFRKLGAKSSFGSDAQVKLVQELARRPCDVLGFSFKSGTRETLILADLREGELRRTASAGGSVSWTSWSGFTRAELLALDPANGFELRGFVASGGKAKMPAAGQAILDLAERLKLPSAMVAPW